MVCKGSWSKAVISPTPNNSVFCFCSSPIVQRMRWCEEVIPGTARTQESRVSVGTQTDESAMVTQKQGQNLPNGHLKPAETLVVTREPGLVPSRSGETRELATRNHSGQEKNSFGMPSDGEEPTFASEVQNIWEERQPQGDGCPLPTSCPGKVLNTRKPSPTKDSPDKVPSMEPPRPSAQPQGQLTPSPEPLLSEGSSNSSTPASPVPAVQNLMISRKEL